MYRNYIFVKLPPPPLYIRYLNNELLSCDVLHLGNQYRKVNGKGWVGGNVSVSREVGGQRV